MSRGRRSGLFFIACSLRATNPATDKKVAYGMVLKVGQEPDHVGFDELKVSQPIRDWRGKSSALPRHDVIVGPEDGIGTCRADFHLVGGLLMEKVGRSPGVDQLALVVEAFR